VGDHVSRIQVALVRLGFLDPDAAQGGDGHYGPRTAAAVLEYKKVLQIINRRYQSAPDNIVGRMTIASLDTAIFQLEGGGGPPRPVAFLGPHPRSPEPGDVSATGAASAGQVSALVGATSPVRAPVSRPAGTAFTSPLSDLPADMQETIRRTNDAKKPDELLLFPFIAKHEGPLSGSDLSARFAKFTHEKDILVDLHTRMKPFDIWKNIRIIVSVYQGIGAHGIFCEPFDHNAFLVQMIDFTKPPGGPPNPLLAKVPLYIAKFCRDSFNVHGPRDSFREMVRQGPGLHICISQPPVRSTHPCDLHIDEIQQGQMCSGGYCFPLVNGQTVGHLITVGPFLVDEAKKHIPQLPRLPDLPKFPKVPGF
jgi:hypothetical protein